MPDVSITDLIARLRYRYEPSNPLANADVAEVMAMAADALESVTAPTESEQYQGLASAMLLLREQEFHFPADSIASAIDELKRLRSLAAEVNMWSAPVDGEDLMCLISEAENFSGEDRTQMLDLIPRLVTAVKAGFRLPVPPEKPLVHNHGPAEGRGLDCNESIVGGFLQGACMRVTEQTDPFSQSPHMASKYWAELVKARNRIAELEAAAVPVEPVQVEVSEVHKQLMRSNIRNAVQREMGCERRAHYGNVEHPFCGEHGHLGQWPCPVSEAVTSAALVAALGGQVEVNDSRIAKALSIIDRDVEALANLDPTELRAALGGGDHG